MNAVLKRVVVVAIPLVSALAMSACGSSLIVKKAPKAGVRSVDIELVPTGCNPAALTLDAGPTNFVVTNRHAGSVTEFEIHDGTTILAEAEFVTPGLAKSFAITLEPGKLTTLCTGGSVNKGVGVLTVTGHKQATRVQVSAAGKRAVAKYRAYLEEQADLLVVRTQALASAIDAGDIPRAKVLYASARLPYERIQSIAKTFSDLNPRINALATEVPPDGHWDGFHRIERALYQEGQVAAMGPTAAQLLTDVTALAQRVRSVRLEPASIANAAVDSLNVVTTRQITGIEEAYSHLDLDDLAANIDGARVAVDAVVPLLPAKSSVSGSTIDGRFGAIEALLAPLRRGTGYVASDELTTTQSRAIVQATDAAAEPISRIAQQIIG